MAKKSYPGGFRLTLKRARKLAVQEFGTVKGLEPDRATDLEGYFTMRMGNLGVSIRPDIGMSGCIEVSVGMSTANHRCIGYFNRETLEPDYDVMDKYERQEKREALEQWVYDGGPEPATSSLMKSGTWGGDDGSYRDNVPGGFYGVYGVAEGQNRK